VNNTVYRNNDSKDLKYGMILLHGRGADADDIISITDEFFENEFLYAAPNAPQNSWYPYSFLAPIEENEPFLTNSMASIGELLVEFGGKGIPAENVILLGFSQGACLALEYALRNPQKYGGIAALSGAVISPDTGRYEYGSFKRTHVFLGCSENDPHIPIEKVIFTAEVFLKMNADVEKRIYEGAYHGVIPAEIDEIKKIIGLLKQK
jgi:phospholipase/carboxylesterase